MGHVYLLGAKPGKCGSCIFVRGQARKVWGVVLLLTLSVPDECCSSFDFECT